jgi:hypothetical protein
MNKQLKSAWIKALRSRKFKQTNSELQAGNKYCCLGVLCRVAQKKGLEVFEEDGELEGGSLEDQPDEIASLLDAEHQSTLISMNDDLGRKFYEIARWIEKNVETS